MNIVVNAELKSNSPTPFKIAKAIVVINGAQALAIVPNIHIYTDNLNKL